MTRTSTTDAVKRDWKGTVTKHGQRLTIVSPINHLAHLQLGSPRSNAEAG